MLQVQDLQSRFDRIVEQPTPVPVIVGTFLVPLTISYLVHLSNTRALRIGLWPVGILCWTWMTLTVRLGPIWSLRLVLTGIIWNWGAATRWAFSQTSPQYHPLPRKPPFPRLRNNILFKTWELVYNEHRHIGIKGYTPPLQPITKSYPYARGVLHHYLNFIRSTFLVDLFGFPLVYLGQNTVGNVNQVTSDWPAFCAGVSNQYGVPMWSVRLFFVICYGGMVHFGMTCPYHLLATIGVASGIYLPEEWPAVTHQPPYSTSLNELWGKRWHQMMRDLFLLLARPFKILPKPLHLLSVFFFSALLHILIYYPRKRELVILPYMTYFMLNGLGIVLERLYRQITGRRVGGVVGWIWTWGFLLLTSLPIIELEYSSGWVGAMRSVFSTNPEQSMVIQLLYLTGYGKHPDAYRQVDLGAGIHAMKNQWALW